ncbi:hypothetical protein [Streptomyces hesseae]|uniref:Secreted protein n=1 Tax=Streptomyces hesseae TaxID=3075519 RepID=A0ABU2SLF3_9ACTN|nr:hypothetical protein [Streptomyces sp. DSM 40473]MDT0449722.1 hypothetical protein [Streptomyces sp. DSM 40473]
MGRFWGRVPACASAVAALVAGPAGLPASAQGRGGGGGALVACVGSQTIRFSPGMTLEARPTQVRATACYSCTGTDSAVRWGTSVIEGDGLVSCLSNAAPAVEDITWNTGEHSKIAYRMPDALAVAGETVAPAPAPGKVITGRYKGHFVLSPGAQLSLSPLECASNRGVELISGPVTLAVL